MGVCEALTAVKYGEDRYCRFNGYVEDYLNVGQKELSEQWKQFLEELLMQDRKVRICVGLRLDINPQVVTNRIIRYKDAFKIAQGALYYPFIIYGYTDNNLERALIITQEGKEEYLKAKGLYYCMSEPLGMYEHCRNEIVSVDFAHAKEAWFLLFVKKEKCGNIQRKLDNEILGEYEELKNIALGWAKDVKASVVQKLAQNPEEKEAIIKEAIVTWFLIKKILYVSYMMNRHFFNSVHNKDIKAQRTMAKTLADSVGFISLSELWKL